MRKGTLPEPRRVLTTALDQALAVQHPVVVRHVEWLRRRRPSDPPTEVVRALERQYLATVTGTGAAVGGAAAAPGLGTVAALSLSAGEAVTFLQATSLFCLAVAEVHGHSITDTERRKALLMTALLGESSARAWQRTVGPAGRDWGRVLTDRLPAARVQALNAVLGRWFAGRFARREGLLTVGRLVPFGVGAAVGGVGNAALARGVIAEVHRAFGDPATRPESAAVPEQAARLVSPLPPAPPATDGETPASAGAEEPPAADTKYRPLFEHLAGLSQRTVSLPFETVDALVPGGLPATARLRRSWWTTRGDRSQARAWAAAGFRVSAVDLDAATVELTRD